jgi:hypothetical protein
MENYEWKKASEKLEETTRQFEHFLIDIKLAHLKMKIEILKNNYSFQKKENVYKKRIIELEEKLNDKKFEYSIIDVEVKG